MRRISSIVNLTRSDAISVILIFSILLNAGLVVGLAVTYKVGYQEGLDDGVSMGAQLSQSDPDESATISSDMPSDAETSSYDKVGTTETSTDTSSSIQAGVSFNQSGSNVTVHVISMENADRLVVQEGERQTVYLSSIGDEAVLRNIESGDKITVIGYKDGRSAIIQKIQMP